jgi:hypothetical protein
MGEITFIKDGYSTVIHDNGDMTVCSGINVVGANNESTMPVACARRNIGRASKHHTEV